MMRRKKESGFTLIELMIVIAVIGILAVVLIPKVGNVKTSAKLNGVETNFRSVTAAVQGLRFTTDELASQTAVNAAVLTKLQTVFSGDNELTNPITKSVTIQSTSTNGVILVHSDLTDPNTTTDVPAYAGSVIVKPVLTNGVVDVTVFGCDQDGRLITDLRQVIQP